MSMLVYVLGALGMGHGASTTWSWETPGWQSTWWTR